MMLKKIIAVLLCALLLCACSAEQPTGEGVETVTFTDALGREVTVQKEPQRVAALIGSFADVWLLAGGSLCAAADDAWSDFGLELPADTLNIGATKSPSLEILLSATPQLVIASASTAKNLEWRELLEDAGITVAYFDVACFEDYLAMLDVCTDITGRKDLYEQNGAALKDRIDEVKGELAAEGKHPTVLFLRASASFVRAKNSEGSILGEMLAELGCVNIADSDAALLEKLSIESIIKQDPEHIFIVQVGDDSEAANRALSKMMDENPAWRELTAVKRGKIHYMDKRLFNFKPNARWAEAYERLAEILRETE